MKQHLTWYWHLQRLFSHPHYQPISGHFCKGATVWVWCQGKLAGALCLFCRSQQAAPQPNHTWCWHWWGCGIWVVDLSGYSVWSCFSGNFHLSTHNLKFLFIMYNSEWGYQNVCSWIFHILDIICLYCYNLFSYPVLTFWIPFCFPYFDLIWKFNRQFLCKFPSEQYFSRALD